jgi:hypothetical protein
MGSPGSIGSPPARVVVVVTLALEAVAVTAYGIYLGVETVVAPALERLAAAVLTVLVLALGAGLALLARAVLRARRWARSPVLVWQVLQASIAVPALGTRWPLGVALLAACVVVGAGVLRDDVLPT